MVHTFPKGISPKVDVIAWLEFELAYYDFSVHHVTYYATVFYSRLKSKERVLFLLCFKIKLEAFDRVDTAIWMHYIDANKTAGEKAWRQLRKMLQVMLNKSWRQHTTKQLLYGYLPPITKTIKIRWTRHAGHCWRSEDELISDVLQWIPSHSRAKAGQPARTYIQQLCVDTEYSPEDLPEAMNDREMWRERVKDIRADGMTRWWWWWWR